MLVCKKAAHVGRGQHVFLCVGRFGLGSDCLTLVLEEDCIALCETNLEEEIRALPFLF